MHSKSVNEVFKKKKEMIRVPILISLIAHLGNIETLKIYSKLKNNENSKINYKNYCSGLLTGTLRFHTLTIENIID